MNIDCYTNTCCYFQFSLIVVIAYIIFKYGRLRIVTKIMYVCKKGFKRLNISYKKFHDPVYYYYLFKQAEALTINYEVTVDEGSLHFELRDRKKLIYSRNFTEDEKGSFTFTPVLRFHSFRVEGNQTHGGCKFEWGK